MSNGHNNLIFGPLRLPFLILTPACVLPGAATAVRSGSELNPYCPASIVITIPAVIGAVKHANDIQKLLPYMAIINILPPLLFAVGLFIGGC